MDPLGASTSADTDHVSAPRVTISRKTSQQSVIYDDGDFVLTLPAELSSAFDAETEAEEDPEMARFMQHLLRFEPPAPTSAPAAPISARALFSYRL